MVFFFYIIQAPPLINLFLTPQPPHFEHSHSIPPPLLLFKWNCSHMMLGKQKKCTFINHSLLVTLLLIGRLMICA